MALAGAVGPGDRGRRRPGPTRRPATDRDFALGFVVLGITYLNLRKNVGQWVQVKAVPAEMAGLSAEAWFDLGYLLIALTLLALLVRHARRPAGDRAGEPDGPGPAPVSSCCSGGWSSATSSASWSPSRPSGW